MDELNPTVREQEIYEEMELTPEMVKSIRTLCGTCLRHFVDAEILFDVVAGVDGVPPQTGEVFHNDAVDVTSLNI